MVKQYRKLDDQIITAYFARGSLRSQLGDDRAEDDYTKVVEINPSYYPAFNNRAIYPLNA